jgi:hypothetical protein
VGMLAAAIGTRLIGGRSIVGVCVRVCVSVWVSVSVCVDTVCVDTVCVDTVCVDTVCVCVGVSAVGGVVTAMVVGLPTDTDTLDDDEEDDELDSDTDIDDCSSAVVDGVCVSSSLFVFDVFVCVSRRELVYVLVRSVCVCVCAHTSLSSLA